MRHLPFKGGIPAFTITTTEFCSTGPNTLRREKGAIYKLINTSNWQNL